MENNYEDSPNQGSKSLGAWIASIPSLTIFLDFLGFAFFLWGLYTLNNSLADGELARRIAINIFVFQCIIGFILWVLGGINYNVEELKNK